MVQEDPDGIRSLLEALGERREEGLGRDVGEVPRVKRRGSETGSRVGFFGYSRHEPEFLPFPPTHPQHNVIFPDHVRLQI